ncbi:Uncharacterized conserved protein [Mycobacteroides abscessus subsp. massiliense]|nr:hypothetical protein A3O04_14570 [Mycobacteroides abscessus]EHM18338.1 hypothetical protein MMAS_27970 [Mycobacteroides abscessus subsp. massiliense CCUG 48898 = JCM 15300]ORA90855.1 hypothetical protein BST32_07100 [Mycobacteroides abscessus subsp. massiliense]SIN46812.1 Uncharacterized conserved protein [Mycobacteroides abscessus subsp. bolletii]ANO14900.1 hypothetical protein BAB77_14390 [Mycobacteroides abscessus]
MYLKACLNGVRRKDQHPAIPCTAEEIAADAAACRDAGAAAVHVHAKDAQGFDSLLASAVDPVVATLRARCPGLPVGVTTGAWAMADPAARCAAINGWTELPGGVAGMADARPRGSARCGGADWTGGHTAAAGGNDGGK